MKGIAADVSSKHTRTDTAWFYLCLNHYFKRRARGRECYNTSLTTYQTRALNKLSMFRLVLQLLEYISFILASTDGKGWLFWALVRNNQHLVAVKRTVNKYFARKGTFNKVVNGVYEYIEEGPIIVIFQGHLLHTKSILISEPNGEWSSAFRCTETGFRSDHCLTPIWNNETLICTSYKVLLSILNLQQSEKHIQ